MFPASRKSIALASEWLTAWSSAPKIPAPPMPMPMARMPMCSTEEYASIRLKSAWPTMKTAATTIDSRPSPVRRPPPNSARPAGTRTW